jgi:hypothetical protein
MGEDKLYSLHESIKLTANISSSVDVPAKVRDAAADAAIDFIKKLQTHISTKTSTLTTKL